VKEGPEHNKAAELSWLDLVVSMVGESMDALNPCIGSRFFDGAGSGLSRVGPQ
jgi:hypothetical protein